MWFHKRTARAVRWGQCREQQVGARRVARLWRGRLWDHPDADPRRWWHGILIPATPAPQGGTRALENPMPWRWVSCRAVLPRAHRPARFAVAVLDDESAWHRAGGWRSETASRESRAMGAILMRRTTSSRGRAVACCWPVRRCAGSEAKTGVTDDRRLDCGAAIVRRQNVFQPAGVAAASCWPCAAPSSVCFCHLPLVRSLAHRGTLCATRT